MLEITKLFFVLNQSEKCNEDECTIYSLKEVFLFSKADGYVHFLNLRQQNAVYEAQFAATKSL